MRLLMIILFYLCVWLSFTSSSSSSSVLRKALWFDSARQSIESNERSIQTRRCTNKQHQHSQWNGRSESWNSGYAFHSTFFDSTRVVDYDVQCALYSHRRRKCSFSLPLQCRFNYYFAAAAALWWLFEHVMRFFFSSIPPTNNTKTLNIHLPFVHIFSILMFLFFFWIVLENGI